MNRVHSTMMEGLQRNGRDILLMEYACLSASATTQRLSDWIGRSVTFDRRPNLARQNPSRILDRFSNTDELLAYLAGRGLGRWVESG